MGAWALTPWAVRRILRYGIYTEGFGQKRPNPAIDPA